MANPLMQFSRLPKIYVRLPTLGKFYPKDFIETSPTGEVPVKAMTAIDEMTMRNPESLLNGDAVFKVLKSCIGYCKNVKDLHAADVDAILLAIRYASNGDKLTLETTCPSCQTISKETVSIRSLVDAITDIGQLNVDPIYTIDVSSGVKINIILKPSLYIDVVNANLLEYENIRMKQFLETNPSIGEEEKTDIFNTLFQKFANFRVGMLLNAIESVDVINLTNGDPVITKNTNKAEISEFIRDLEKSQADEIRERIEKLNEIGIPKTLNVTCGNCGHKYSMEVKFDPVNFSDSN